MQVTRIKLTGKILGKLRGSRPTTTSSSPRTRMKTKETVASEGVLEGSSPFSDQFLLFSLLSHETFMLLFLPLNPTLSKIYAKSTVNSLLFSIIS